MTTGAEQTGLPAVPGQYLTFALAGEQFAVPILSVQEIRGWETVSRTPGSLDYILGVMNLRGAVVPVIDLRARLGMEPGERTSTSVVIVVRVDTGSSGPITVGCLVDGVADVISLSDDAMKPPPAICGSLDSHFLAAVATVDRQLVMLLHLARLIATAMPSPDQAMVG
jgi:purine-binding chemotaxis protein CheW